MTNRKHSVTKYKYLTVGGFIPSQPCYDTALHYLSLIKPAVGAPAYQSSFMLGVGKMDGKILVVVSNYSEADRARQQTGATTARFPPYS